MNKTMKESVYDWYKGDMFLNMFGGINLSMLRGRLIGWGFKRIPTDDNLEKMCNDLFAHDMVGNKINFVGDKKKGKVK